MYSIRLYSAFSFILMEVSTASRTYNKNGFSDGSFEWINEFPPLCRFSHYCSSQKCFPFPSLSPDNLPVTQGQVEVFYPPWILSVTLYLIVPFFSPIEIVGFAAHLACLIQCLMTYLGWHIFMHVYFQVDCKLFFFASNTIPYSCYSYIKVTL